MDHFRGHESLVNLSHRSVQSQANSCSGDELIRLLVTLVQVSTRPLLRRLK